MHIAEETREWLAYQVGIPIESVPRRVGGNSRSAVFRAETPLGQVAVKLRENRPDIPHWTKRLARGLAVQNAMFDHGLPVPSPFPLRNGDLFDVCPVPPHAILNCEQWVEGIPGENLTSSELDFAADTSLRIARVTLEISIPSDAECDDTATPPFEALLAIPGAPEEARGAADVWERIFLTDDASPIILAHRDLQRRNIVRSPRGIVIVDWENAGFTGIGSEIARLVGLWDDGLGRPQTPRIADALLYDLPKSEEPGVHWFGEWLSGYARFLLHLLGRCSSCPELGSEAARFWEALVRVDEWTSSLVRRVAGSGSIPA